MGARMGDERRGSSKLGWILGGLALVAGAVIALAVLGSSEEKADCAEQATAGELMERSQGGEPLPPELASQLRESFPEAVRDDITSLEGRLHEPEGRTQAFAFAVVADEELPREDVAEGFAEGSGEATEETDLDGHGVYVAEVQQGTAILSFPHDCGVLTVVAPDRGEAERRTLELLSQ